MRSTIGPAYAGSREFRGAVQPPGGDEPPHNELFEFELVVAVPGGHVGNDDAIAGLQALGNLRAVIGDAAEENLNTLGLFSIAGDSVKGNRRAALGLQWIFDEGGDGDPLNFNGAAGRKIGASFTRLRADDLEIDADGAILDIGIHAHDTSGIGTILQSNGSGLIDFDAAGLRLWNMDAGHEARRICDAGKDGARADLLAVAYGNFFDHTVEAGADDEGFFLLGAQRVKSLHLSDFGLLGGELGLAGFFGDTEFFPFDLQAGGEGIGLGARDFGIHQSAELILVERIVALGFELRLSGVGFELRFERFFVQELSLQLNAEIGELSFRFLHGEFGVGDLAIEVRIAEMENDGVWTNTRARTKKNLIDAAFGTGGKPALVFRNKISEAVDVADHRTRLNGDDLERIFLDGRRGGAEPQNTERNGEASSEDQYSNSPAEKQGTGPKTEHKNLRRNRRSKE